MPDLPAGLNRCNPKQRSFPLSWREAYFRSYFNDELDGYTCPNCLQLFQGCQGFSQLRGDHIHPFSAGGLTVWENLQLLCNECNSKKGNCVNSEVH
ncbi:MAG: HNH endonuclease [Chamaesiphon sp.]|nr:HNH endonuclease [Chamaesiphon sp.]